MAKLAAIFLVVVSLNVLRETEANECKEFVKKMMMDQMKHVMPCITSLNLVKPEEKKEKVFCIMRCVLQKAQMLGADGNVDFDLVNKIMEGVPDGIKDKANAIFSECGHHAASLDPSEASCQSYGALITCLTEISGKMCST